MLIQGDAQAANRSVLIVDDDDLSRAVLCILLEADGFRVEAAESGDAALALLARRGSADLPELVLTDLQMPGTIGNELAGKLRDLCGSSVCLLAMSGTDVSPDEVRGYDAFLRKPFEAEEVLRAMAQSAGSERERSATNTSSTNAILDDATYTRLAAAMNAQHLLEMYTLCVTDIAQRVTKMRVALRHGDDEVFRREAHTIKGGCGMLGALELRELAGTLEASGLEARPTSELHELLDAFMAASERLQRILELRWRQEPLKAEE